MSADCGLYFDCFNKFLIYLVIERLQAVHLVVDDINSTSRDVAKSDYEPSLEVFSASISRLLSDYSTEYDRYRMDEIVVAAVTPTVRDETPAMSYSSRSHFLL